MKKLLFFLWLLSISSFQAKAQQQHYKSILGTQSTVWETAWSNLPGNSQITISVQKDTLVNGLLYKKIVSSIPQYYRGGLLREDTLAGKVWLKHLYTQFPPPNNKPDDTIEVMLFNYNLAVGDTFKIGGSGYGVNRNMPDSLSIVDSVFYKNGLKHIRFKHRHGVSEGLTMIEGIGGNLGVFWRKYAGGLLGQYLLCSYKNGVKTAYTNIRFNGSYSVNGSTGIKEDKSEAAISLYPNPAQNKLFFDLPEGVSIQKVVVRNAIGKQVLQQDNLTDSGLNIAELPVGLYYVQLHFKDNKYFAGTFIKRN